MSYNEKYWTCRPSTKDEQEKIRWYRLKNLDMAYNSKSENWMQWILWKLYRETGIKFNRQKIHWTRIYDFRCHSLWVVVEVDWWYHETEWKKKKDERYDKYNYEVSGIKIYRIKPYDDCYATEMIKEIKKDVFRNQRKLSLWISMSKWMLKDAMIKDDKKFFDYIDDVNKWDTLHSKMKNKTAKINKWRNRKQKVDEKANAIKILDSLL